MAAAKPSVAAVKNNGCTVVFMGLWLAGWMLGTLLFDCFLAYSVVCQCWAFTYASTQGTITAISIDSNSDSDSGITYTPEVNYIYTVGGQNLQGNRISYFAVSSSYHTAQEVVDSFRVGKPATVYYRP